jgi:hypothetical protein
MLKIPFLASHRKVTSTGKYQGRPALFLDAGQRKRREMGVLTKIRRAQHAAPQNEKSAPRARLDAERAFGSP